MTDNGLKKWQRYIESKIGFVLPPTQERWLNNAIEATANRFKISEQEFWEQVHADPHIRQQLFDAVLILESRFFRHPPSLEFIIDLAKAHHSQAQGHPFKIWSVGCSTGQEVWSLAMMLDYEQLFNYQLLGTDVSLQAIKKANKACYSFREKARIPAQYSAYITSIDVDKEEAIYNDEWQVVEALRNKATFKYHNVFTSGVPTLLKQDVIICQNMLIYFRQFDQRDILAKLVSQCQVGGYLVLAPGEALFWRHSKMQRISNPNVNVWQKISA